MTALGVFRDTFYNAIYALASAQAISGPTATGVLAATLLAGAQECYTSVGGTSQTYTTDSAVNIIAQLQQAVAAAQKANVGGFASALSDTPPPGVPNFFNLTWFVNINTNGVTTGATLAAGAGVTLNALTGAPAAGTLGTAGNALYIVTVTGPTTVTFTRVG